MTYIRIFTIDEQAVRRRWTPENSRCQTDEWRNLLFTYDCRFSVQPDNISVINCQERFTRNNLAFVHKSITFN